MILNLKIFKPCDQYIVQYNEQYIDIHTLDQYKSIYYSSDKMLKKVVSQLNVIEYYEYDNQL